MKEKMVKIKNKRNKGITLIALVATVIILLILVGLGVVTLMPGGLIDKAVQSRFVTNFKAVEEGVLIYKNGKEIEQYGKGVALTKEEKLPLLEEISKEEKAQITEKIPSLAEEIIGRNQGKSLSQIKLYEIDKEKANVKNIKHKYLIDMTNEQIYDYEGEKFQSRMWHTIEGITGSEEENKDIFDGWIRLTLYYPENSTEQKWLLKGEGEIREEDWKDYEGPIWVQLSRVKDVYIKYKLDGEDFIIPPAGKVGVIIEPESYEIETGGKVKVKVTFEKGLAIQEYKVGSEGWKAYTGEFEVTDPTLIEARGKRIENIYDTDGNKIGTKEVWGRDSAYIRKKGTPTGSWGNGGNTVPGDGNGGNGSGGSGGDGGSGGTEEGQTPSYRVKGPVITVTPGTIAEEISVTVNPPVLADKIYIQIGNGKYEEYTRAVKVKENTVVRAYYTTTKGETSETSTKYINNIKQAGKPYVAIEANPYPYSYAKKVPEVEIGILSDGAERVEYSTDGVIYHDYSEKFKVNKNGRIYARAIATDEQVATDAIDITNIGTEPSRLGKLAINIMAKPDPMVSDKITDKVTVKIEYDKKAEEKYYSLGEHGKQIPYTGEFEVTQNTVVYAYAKSKVAVGKESRAIDNISTGIIDPQIHAIPGNGLQASKVKIGIAFDRNATLKRYEIDGTGLRDYTGEFEVTKNCTIRAYSENSLGQKAESTYKVENIVEPVPPIVIDQGDYYILKLNYPEGSTGREYKIGNNGAWGPYKEAGILLVKAEYKDNILNADGSVKIQIKDETGKEVNWTGDVYVLTTPITEIMEDIHMRWDTVKPGTPQIVLNTEEPAREVEVNIIYAKNITKKQYKVIDPDGNTEGWKEYNGSFKVERKNTVVLAKGMNSAEVWGGEATKKITNIDEEQPVIKLTADLDKLAQEIGIKVEVTDDVRVAEVRWAQGVRGESYFANGVGNSIPNNSIVKITENGYYTFYAEDGVGNKQVYTINVTNIDLTPPDIIINVTPDNTIGIEAKATIDYGDSIKKEYKIGEKGTWATYRGEITLNSYDILNKGLQNSDKTVTIYARGTDTANNITEENKKVLSLDLDMPAKPVINSNYGYPILTSYGVKVNGKTTITYDNRNDIENLYSLDGGTTWQEYKGEFQATGGTVKAKSVKKSTGLSVEISKTLTMPGDALGPLAYDGNDNTESNEKENRKILVDSSMRGKRIRIHRYSTQITANPGRKVLADERYDVNSIVTIPETATELIMRALDAGNPARVKEIEVCNEPTFKAINNGYMLLHADPTKAIRKPYQMIVINYFPTSVQRLYRIGTTGEWKNYEDKEIWVNQGETIYAKGIDQYGNETRITSSYTANVADALGPLAYDGNDSTESNEKENRKILVDSSMRGKRIRIHRYSTQITANPGGKVLANERYDVNSIVTIPETATELIMRALDAGNPARVKEIEVCNEPTFKAINNGYMLLHADPTKAIRKPYQMIVINYFPTSVQRLYRIGTTGEWKNYEDKEIWVNQGETIYAKGIDQYGNETRITSSYTANVADALGPLAYDGNDNTESNEKGNRKILVDSSMRGKRIRIHRYSTQITANPGGKVLANERYDVNSIVTIPETATELIMRALDAGNPAIVKEIEVLN